LSRAFVNYNQVFSQNNNNNDNIDIDTKNFKNDTLNPFLFMFQMNEKNLLEKSFENILFDLITKGDLNSIKSLVCKNSRMEYKICSMLDAYNQTALLVAVKLNNFEIFEYLIEMGGTNLDHCDNSGWTSLRYSAWMGNEGFVRILLENGASVDASDSEGRTALRAAIFSGHEHIVELLVKYKANGNFFILFLNFNRSVKAFSILNFLRILN
jgi:ankyrin repeat protein